MDLERMKDGARAAWSTFAPMEATTGSVATKLVKFARVAKDHAVLDVGCGTGVTSLAAARTGARVTAADLTPALLERARENASIAGVEIAFAEADVEALPYPDASFDVVMSQFGHMFAPRPEVATREMLRVLRPGGTLAFATWPPHLFVGRMFTLTARFAPPTGGAPPPLWGDPNVVTERLGDGVTDLTFTMDTLWPTALSPAHIRSTFELFGPMGRLVSALAESDPAKLAAFRAELDALVAVYFEDNRLRQDFLLTRATKR